SRDPPGSHMPTRLAANLTRADRFGLTASLLCAIHCALLPLAIALLPSLGVAAWLGNEGFEEGFVVFATLFGLFTLVSGYRKHRAVRALRLLVPGLAILWFRSEERRVGKECRCRWSAEHANKKRQRQWKAVQ